MTNKKKVLHGVLLAVAMIAVVIVVQYIRARVMGVTYQPNWFDIVPVPVISGLAAAFGPDAVQRRKNRKDLADKLKM